MDNRNKIHIIILAVAVAIALLTVLASLFVHSKQEEDVLGYDIKRQQMVENQIVARGITSKKVIKAMLKVPRHQFVSEELKASAYEDRPLPIGEGQTISQPYIVALMTKELKLSSNHKVLEIGTGSGYQAAILAEIADEVYTVEIITSLYETAKERLEKMYPDVKISNHDGYYGWEEYAPYDRIIVTAAPDHIPRPLIDQLVDGGIMVIPVGPPGWNQVLWKVTKEGDNIKTKRICDVTFVPLVREE
ncbi:MAG: protein-L-isoaspartate(D-aspartate) O-methyltransferase [Candidatus Humimicrobiaceae bacterium]|jgi:protein-L-isoaspartate(D-aspartate) O-methyltransferase|nr:protein-L-isoaspartate(D-aspartate) O-methyltransferase [Actinomycetota bacterium]MDD5600207.1 protein-L-isoaspartate(D-aspartate) O-methyltransferase [Actinomycetota bacterium]MDY0028124.1 protein-L-isoaspartate(D-aspartate) O-methyltransferase [Candidatus Humimicrobiaceae bacterium]